MKLEKSFHQGYFEGVLKHLEKMLICDPHVSSVICQMVGSGYKLGFQSEAIGGWRYVTLSKSDVTNASVAEFTTNATLDKELPTIVAPIARSYDPTYLAADIFYWMTRETGLIMHVAENGSIPGYSVDRVKNKTAFFRGGVKP